MSWGASIMALDEIGEVKVEQGDAGLTFTLRWWQLALIIGVLGAGVLGLRDSNRELGTKIEELGETIGRLDQRLSLSDTVIDEMGGRIGKLEALTARGVPPDWVVERIKATEARIDKIEARVFK